MSKKFLLPEQGQFYKANLHCHSTLSDGRLTLEQLKQAYRGQGYAIVAYTDHNRYAWHPELCDEGFLALAAYEIDINAPMEPGDYNHCRTYHLNFYDTDPQAQPAEKQANILAEQRYDCEYINAFIERMNRLGFLCCYNHPYWSLQTLDDYKNLRGLFAMEIYNHGCEIDGLYGYNPQVYDEMLRTGQRLGCLMTDDNHNFFPFGDPLCDSFGGFTMVKAAALTYPAVIAALKHGDYYASMGPELHGLWLEDGKLHVRCSPVEKIFVVTDGRDCYKHIVRAGESLTEASFELTGKEAYIRVDCRDEKGLHACSRAYYAEELR